MRVAAGGHNIPESTIRRRYEAGIHNLFELYIPISDYWMVTDNSMSPMEVIAKGFRNDKKRYIIRIFTLNLNIMSEQEVREFEENIVKGANIAFQRLVNQKRKKTEN